MIFVVKNGCEEYRQRAEEKKARRSARSERLSVAAESAVAPAESRAAVGILQPRITNGSAAGTVRRARADDTPPWEDEIPIRTLEDTEAASPLCAAAQPQSAPEPSLYR